MAKDDSYEIMPYKEIVDLKKQVSELQGRGDTSSKELLQSMGALTKSMNNMLQLFSSAAEEMKLEEKTESELSQKVAPLIEKVERLEDQNKTIAEGMVAIASMVKDIRREKMKRPEVIHKPAPPPPKPPEKSPFEDLPPLEPPEAPLGPPGPKPMPPPKGPMPMPPPGAPLGPPGAPMPPPGLMPPPGMGPPPGGPMPPPGMGPPPGAGLGPLPPLPPLEEEPKKKKGLFGLFKKK